MQPKRSYTYYKAIFATVPKPFAFVDLDLFDENARQVKARAGEKRIRVASKSLRCRALLKRVLESDAQYRGILAFSAYEAAFLSRHGFDDLVVAYPIWEAGQIEAVLHELKRGKQMAVMVDSAEHVRRLDEFGQRHGVAVPVCIDVDMSSDFPGLHFGVYRSGLTGPKAVEKLLPVLRASASVQLVGVMGYEAQIAGVPDRVPGQVLKNWLVRLLKKKSAAEVRRRRQAVVELLSGENLRFVNAGGTGSLETSREEAWVTEVTAGSGFFAPALFDSYARFRHLPAAAFAIEITRHPTPEIYTCLGGGYVASGAASKDRLPKPYLPEGARLLALEGAGEVQTPVLYRGPHKLQLGDPIFLRHAKAGELCERFNTVYLVSEGRIVEEVPTYRGEGRCFF